MKLDTGEQPIERRGAYDEGHAGGDGLVLDRRELQFSTLPWPPSGWWVIGRYFRRPRRHQVAALIGVAPDLRAILASHVTLQFVDRVSSSADGQYSAPPSGAHRSQGTGLRDSSSLR